MKYFSLCACFLFSTILLSAHLQEAPENLQVYCAEFLGYEPATLLDYADGILNEDRVIAVQSMVQNGADIHINQTSEKSPLNLSIENFQQNTACYLIKNGVYWDMYTYHLALKLKQSKVLKKLITLGATKIDQNYQIAFEDACSNERFQSKIIHTFSREYFYKIYEKGSKKTLQLFLTNIPNPIDLELIKSNCDLEKINRVYETAQERNILLPFEKNAQNVENIFSKLNVDSSYFLFSFIEKLAFLRQMNIDIFKPVSWREFRKFSEKKLDIKLPERFME